MGGWRKVGEQSVSIRPIERKDRRACITIMREVLHYRPEDAAADMKDIMADSRIAFVAEVGQAVVGFIGAIPQYGVTGWELHPLAVNDAFQHRGIGRKLVERLEAEVKQRGGVMIYLGSDDESNRTSLGGVDLYQDTFEKLKHIQNLDNHPYTFYEKLGYRIVGVFPDANGRGKPDLWLAKTLP